MVRLLLAADILLEGTQQFTSNGTNSKSSDPAIGNSITAIGRKGTRATLPSSQQPGSSIFNVRDSEWGRGDVAAKDGQ